MDRLRRSETETGSLSPAQWVAILRDWITTAHGRRLEGPISDSAEVSSDRAAAVEGGGKVGGKTRGVETAQTGMEFRTPASSPLPRASIVVSSIFTDVFPAPGYPQRLDPSRCKSHDNSHVSGKRVCGTADLEHDRGATRYECGVCSRGACRARVYQAGVQILIPALDPAHRTWQSNSNYWVSPGSSAGSSWPSNHDQLPHMLAVGPPVAMLRTQAHYRNFLTTGDICLAMSEVQPRG